MKRMLNFGLLALALATLATICVKTQLHNQKYSSEVTIGKPNILKDIVSPCVQIMDSHLSIYGSGVVVYQDEYIAYILTAAHVTRHIEGIQVCQPKGYMHTFTHGEVVYQEEGLDLALVKTAPIWDSVASIVTEAQYKDSLSLYQECLMYGHPGRVDQGQLTGGYICDFHDEGRLRTSCNVWYGNSGCGIFAVINGHWTLISITQQMFIWPRNDFPVTHISFGCSVNNMIAFLNLYLPKK